MSGFQTHMFIGAVGGLGLARVLNVPVQLNQQGGIGWGLIVSSALLATLPDIDEPNSWIAQRFRFVISLLIGCVGFMSAVLAEYWNVIPLRLQPYSTILPVVGALVGAGVFGPMLAHILLRLIRRGAGGHRRLTHSGVVALLLAGCAWFCWQNALLIPAVALGCLAWAILIHDVGDVVTPAGVPLLYPLSSVRIGVPRPIARHGESLVMGASVVIAWILV